MKVIGIHLLNDYSGSPLVFSEILKGLDEKGFDCELITNKHQGFLSDLPNIDYNHIEYNWSKSKVKTLLFFFLAQLQLFEKIVKDKKAQIVYINTILPFAAAIAGKLSGKKVIYHIHETSVKPVLLKRFLFKVIEWTADQSVFVSKYLAEEEKLNGIDYRVVHNALPKAFSQLAEKAQVQEITKEKFRVLMLCSLKPYKGINEFLSLCRYLPEIEFDLVLNANEVDIKEWLGNNKLPSNFHWYPVQSNVHPFYERASLVLNLSKPDGWVETFGMTALEAMAYGIPVIVPPVGGIAELVQDNVNGFHIDSRDVLAVAQQIEVLFENKKLYTEMAEAALVRSKSFSIDRMNESVFESLNIFENAESSPNFRENLNYTQV